MHHRTCGISSLLHSVNPNLFTLLLVYLILCISPHNSHHLRSQHLSLPRPFTPDLYNSSVSCRLDLSQGAYCETAVALLLLRCLAANQTTDRPTCCKVHSLVSGSVVFSGRQPLLRQPLFRQTYITTHSQT